MATYRIVDMYRKNKPINGIHYDSWVIQYWLIV